MPFRFLFASVVAASLCVSSDVAAAEQPNILFILADDLAWSDLGCYGHAWHETPHLDQLAADGVRFTDAYAPAPICSASRASILTGKTPARLHFEFVTKNEAGQQKRQPTQTLRTPPFTLNLPLDEVTIAERMCDAGYSTAFFGKWHLNAHHGRYLGWSPTHGPQQQGFQTVEEGFGSHPYSYGRNNKPPAIKQAGQYPPDSVTDRAAAYLGKHHDGPFFLTVSHFYVHTPVDTRCQWLLEKYEQRIPADALNRERRVRYAAFVETLDHYVGQLLAKLDSAGLRDSTFVVFTSDNGGHPQFTANGPLRGSKWNLYEGGIRVPLIARWPRQLPAKGTSSTPVVGYDLAPTFAAAAGLKLETVNGAIDGKSLLDVMRDPTRQLERELYWHFPYYHPESGFAKSLIQIGIDDFAVSQTRPHSAVRRGDFKLLHFYEDQRSELYNLSNDLSEQKDLSGSNQPIRDQLRETLTTYLDTAAARRPKPLAKTADPNAARDSRPPNIVFVYTDDQAAWGFGGSGYAQAHTPNMDQLARDGAWLRNSFVTTPVCSPARASLMTSRYASEYGILDFIPAPGHKLYDADHEVGLDPASVTFPEVLQANGYATGLVGKWHLGDWTAGGNKIYHPTNHGFDYFMGLTGGGTTPENPALEVDGQVRSFKGLTTDILTDHAVQFIREHAQQKFLLCLHYRAPHARWLPVADEDWAPYQDLDPEIPNPDYPDLDVAKVKRMTREYLASISGVDRNLGRVLQTLAQEKLTQQTVVIFTSDHGYNMGHNGIHHKGNGIWATKTLPKATQNIAARYRPNLYDNSLKVPAIVRWPGVVAPGTVIDHLTTNLDWYPTLVEMAEAAPPKNHLLRGRSLVPLLKGQNVVDWPEDFYGEYSMINYCRAFMRTYRTPHWKLVRDFLNPKRDELYDLQCDPAESRNLIRESGPELQQVIMKLDVQIQQHMRDLKDPLLLE